MTEKTWGSQPLPAQQPVYGGVQNVERFTETYRNQLTHQQTMYRVYLELLEIGAWDKLKKSTQQLFKQPGETV